MPTDPIRVLIVDDHPSFRRAARELLRARGFAVVGEAADASSALSLVAVTAPHSVLLDVRLGADSGLAVASALRRAYPAVGVLLVTSDQDHAALAARCPGTRGPVSKLRLAGADLAALLAPADG